MYDRDARSSWLRGGKEWRSFYEVEDHSSSTFTAGKDSDLAIGEDSVVGRDSFYPKSQQGSTIEGTAARESSRTFGTIFGVFLPCLQNILGVILFLRLPWIVGQAGVLVTLGIICLCVLSTFLTTLSMSALATNGRISGGGPYGILLSNLGPEFAGSIGVLFYLGTTIAATMYTLGGVEALFTNFVEPPDTVFFPFDRQVIGICWTCLLGCIVLAGMKWVAKASLLFLAIVLSAILFMTLGVIFFAAGIWDPPGVEHASSARENLVPQYSPDSATGQETDFMSLLALFYPSVTGIMAGCNRSAVLAKPSRAIPKGTLGAIFTTTSLYIITVLLFGFTVANVTLKENKLVAAFIAWPHQYVVAVGIIMSTVGAGLQSLAGAPQLLRGIANDGHIPFLRIFGTEDPSAEPRRAVLLTVGISATACLAGNLDYITPIITMFFLTMYAAINAACFLSGVLKSPGFRPTWHYFHWSTALLGAVVCVVFMLLISILYAFVALFLVCGIYLYIRRVRETKEWGDALFGLRLDQAKNALLDLSAIHSRQQTKELRRRKRRYDATRANRTSANSGNVRHRQKVPAKKLGDAICGCSFVTCCGPCCSRPTKSKRDGETNYDSDGTDSISSGDSDANFGDNYWFEEADAYQEQCGGHVRERDWRPQILVLAKLRKISGEERMQAGKAPSFATGAPVDGSTMSIEMGNDNISKGPRSGFRVTHPSLLQLASQLKKGRGLTIVNSMIHGSVMDSDSKVRCARARHFLNHELQRHDVAGFTDVVLGSGADMSEALRVIFQSKGLGMLSPNTVMLAWPSKWRVDAPQTATSHKKGLLSKRSSDNSAFTLAASQEPYASSSDPLMKTDAWKHQSTYVQMLKDAIGCQKALIVVKCAKKVLPRFEMQRPIDVWWLIHDGDMLVLLPYLLRRHKVWAKSKLRIFAIADDLIDFQASSQILSEHLAELRITAEVHMIHVGASHARDIDQNRTIAHRETTRPETSILNTDMFKPLDAVMEDVSPAANDESDTSSPKSPAFAADSSIRAERIDSSSGGSARSLLRRFSSGRPRSNSADKGTNLLGEATDPSSVAETVSQIAKHIKGTSGTETQKWINEKYKKSEPSSTLSDLFTSAIDEGVEPGEDNDGATDTAIGVSEAAVSPPISASAELGAHDAMTKESKSPTAALTAVSDVEIKVSQTIPSEPQPPKIKAHAENVEDGFFWSESPDFVKRSEMLAIKAKDKQRLEKRLKTAAYLNQKILEHSAKSGLVVLNLPLSRNTPSLEFIRYTEELTRDLPRVIMLRGYGTENVSTFN